ncbi:hypothetical protein LTR62_008858 [Meristemomyces frigidus]|uniref:Uncharacterized protein n=1 Tax=Meristemomyces frigidus TaxID=1508187 RepID=A0AAN7TKH3_9PEZI|nr:hypothetical protein LTR62_008858 [Meristemomyces frigidus]
MAAPSNRIFIPAANLETYDPSTPLPDPGPLKLLFDNRHILPSAAENTMSTYQTYRLQGLIKLGWPTYGYNKIHLDPGTLKLIWYTHAGAEGSRSYALWQAEVVYEMFTSLTEAGFRPMLLGYTNENPYPSIGGSEPPPKPRKDLGAPRRKVTSASGYVSGHSGGKGNPHERVMAIIAREEEREAREREEIVRMGEKAEAVGYGEKVGLLGSKAGDGEVV